MASIPAKADEIIPGDVVELTVFVHMKNARGHYVKGDVRKKRSDGTWTTEIGPISKPVRMVGRVILIGKNEDHRMSLYIERTNMGDVPEGAVLPFVVDFYTLRSLDWPSTKLRRRPDLGPTNRAGVAGIEFMRQLLVDAAGGGPHDPAAVARLAACVGAGAVVIAKDEGRLPYRLGERYARKMLQGMAGFSEAAYRQLTGRAEIPEAIDEPEEAVQPPAPTERPRVTPPTDRPYMIVLEPSEEALRQHAIILAAFPDAVIRDVMKIDPRLKPDLDDPTMDLVADPDDTPEREDEPYAEALD